MIHPDLDFYTNMTEITGIIGQYLDKFCMKDGYSWYADTPFMVIFTWNGFNWNHSYMFRIVDPTNGKIVPTDYGKMLDDLIEYRPLTLTLCPVCRVTRITEPNGFRSNEVCGDCHSHRTFNMYVTSIQGVREFCERRFFKLPPNFGGLTQ